jgi:hypothetical protein
MSTLTRKITLVWLAWAVIIFIYQEMVPARLNVVRPDYAVSWTPSATTLGSNHDKPYLIDPFLNTHVAWDSEYYLQQAVGGYNDPRVRQVAGPDGLVSIGYAFYPFYGFTIRLLALPLRVLGLDEIATATLAGVLVSLLGTLAALLALAEMAKPWLEESGSLRAVFYLLIFPSGFFLAQVYNEGLFMGLAFWSLALIRRQKLMWAGLLAAFAVWTRAVGVALVIPLAWAVFEEIRDDKIAIIGRSPAAGAVATLLPLASWAGFWFSPLGANYRFLEDSYFGRGFLLIAKTVAQWGSALSDAFASHNTQAIVYYLIESAIILFSLAAALALLRKQPGLALFSLAVWSISVFSGFPQSISRYLLAMPTTFMALARLGKSVVFDRAWSLSSVLVMGMMAALFSFDMWVG